ncbi:9113_t:CDS:2 [Acaulospora colombiana]|uniref:9113_t:CDS:1 n=1 Tax=Acaulospora colombiana TaxID=27376 RepID=A0ACA9L3R6_9GLOM|nr:9113_t:CDS:2 [Acaulospora colombiana]
MTVLFQAAFNDALRAEILKSKMSGKCTDIPAQHAGNNIDTPARFIV